MLEVLLTAVTAVSFVSAVGTLIPLFAALAGHRIEEWHRVPRIVTAALLLVSVVAGVGAHRARQSASRPAVAPVSHTPTAVDTVEMSRASLAPTERTSLPAIEYSRPTQTAPGTTVRPVTPRLRIADASGASVPILLAAARNLRQAHALDGVLRERSEQSPELQDLYTVHLTLQATIRQQEEVISAFTLTARGGGFQIEAARAQALERLAVTFKQRLDDIP